MKVIKNIKTLLMELMRYFIKQDMKDIIIYMIQYVIIWMVIFMERIYVISKIINVAKKEIHHLLQAVVIILNIKHWDHFQN